MFTKFKFPTSKPVLNIRYKYFRSQNNNLFYHFNHSLEYALANYLEKSETTKCNEDKFLSNLLMKAIIKKLSY